MRRVISPPLASYWQFVSKFHALLFTTLDLSASPVQSRDNRMSVVGARKYDVVVEEEESEREESEVELAADDAELIGAL